MPKLIVQSHTILTLLGGGSVDSGDLVWALRRAPILVALDGGAAVADAAGVVPDAVIGDLDSLPAALAARLPGERLHAVGDQNDTDFEKALARVAAPVMLGLGLTGARRDHELAAYSALLAYPDKRCVLVSETDIIVMCPPQLTLDLQEGTRVSLYPLVPVVANCAGLFWPLDDLALRPGGRLGTSNQALGGSVTLGVDKPGLLLILPKDQLEALVLALERCDALWPGRDN